LQHPRLTSSYRQKKGLVGKGDKSPSYSYDSTYVRKDPSLFPPPPRTKFYEPGTGPAPPPPKAPKPSLPARDGQSGADAGFTNALHQDHPPALPAKARPPVPPRLPPRQLDGSLPVDDGAGNGRPLPKEPTGYLNQDALNNLGRAGITVHGLGIGTAPPPPLPSRAAAPPVPERKFGGPQPGPSTLSPGTAPPVSVADARAAAAVARDFHDRHGEQVAAGARAAGEANRKYGLAERARAMAPADGAAVAARGPPPPPRPVSWNGSAGSGPPPVPFATKPRG
jgi:hypothetical protein